MLLLTRQKTILSVAFILVVIFWAYSTYVEVGKSVESFKESDYTAKNGFVYDNSWMLGDLSEHKGKKNYSFKEKTLGRYSIEMTADEDGNNIVLQTLMFDDAPNDSIVLIDEGMIMGFVDEATGGRVSVNERWVKKLMSEAERNREAIEKVKGFDIKTYHYKYGGWSITVEK